MGLGQGGEGGGEKARSALEDLHHHRPYAKRGLHPVTRDTPRPAVMCPRENSLQRPIHVGGKRAVERSAMYRNVSEKTGETRDTGQGVPRYA